MDAEPPGIISLSPAITETIYAIGADAGLAANTRYCDFPPQAKGKNRIEAWEQPSAGLARRFGARLIFTDKPVPDGARRECEAAGVKIISIRPTTLEEVYAGMMAVGAETGKEAESAKTVESMRREFGEIAESAKALRERPRVYVEESGKPPVAAGLWVPRLVEIAGGTSGLVGEGQPSRDVSRTELFRYNPEVMAIAWRGIGKNAEMKVISDRGWQGLKAISGEHLHIFDDAILLRPGPRLVEGAKLLAEAVAQAAGASIGGDDDAGWTFGEEGSGLAEKPSI